MTIISPKRVVAVAGLASHPGTRNLEARVTVKGHPIVRNRPVDPELEKSIQVLRARHPVAKRIANHARTG